jgi:outer membrane receptor protein involved in Fe transport
MRRRTILNICTLLCLLASVVSAQITGEIRGIVLDSSGAAVTAAKVTLKSVETGATRTQSVTVDGRFTFPLLQIGNYEVRAEAAGFRASVTQTEVRTGEIASVQFALEIGQVTETVTVTDVVSQLDTENSQIQTAVVGQKVQELPVNRNPNLFALMAPGVAPVSGNNPFLGSGSFNANGGRGRGNNITIDGITATDVSTTGSAGIGALNFSSIKEVKVITNNFSAEYGRNSSSQLMYLTKNGTNDLHGELYEYFQNDKLNARPFFDQTGKTNVTKQNFFGFEAGGPVYIPGVADWRNKVFWHTAYQGDKIRGAGQTRLANVPTPAMLAAVTDPTSKALLDQYKLPSSPSGTLPTSAPNTTNAYQVSVRGDVNLSQNDTLWARYSRYKQNVASSGNTFISSNLPGFGATSKNLPQQATLQEVHLFSPTMVNEFRFGFGRSAPEFPIDTPYPLGPRVQFSSAEVDRFGVWEGLPQGRAQNTYQFTDNLSFTRGQHNLKTGFEYYWLVADSFFDALQRPLLTFTNWANFASGTLTTFQQRFGDSVRANRVRNAFAFFQDDWKVTRNLTLNLGLRYEFAGGPTESNGYISNLNLDNRSAFGAAGAGPLGNLETGKPSFTSNHNWGPRLGFAWNVGGNQKMVIRGGYGIAYDFIFLNPITNQRFLPPFIVTATQSGNFTGSNTYANMVAGTAQIQSETKAIAGKLNTSILNFGAVQPAIDDSLRNPQVHQFNLGVQRDLRGFVLKASYVGTKGNFLSRSMDINPIAARLPAATSVADETARLPQFLAAQTGFNGGNTAYSNRLDRRYNNVILVTSGANSNYHSAQFEVNKRFGAGHIVFANYTIAKSIDDGSDVLGVLINDSSNQQNPFNNRDNRGVSQFDLAQRLVITHQWELPFLKNHSSRVVRTALAGWAFSGITSFRSGFPVALEAGGRRGLTVIPVIGAGAAVRPNAAGPVDINWIPLGQSGAYNGTVNPDGVQAISSYASSLGLSQPLLGNFGGLGRNVHRLNGERNFDWNIYKNFRPWERAYFQIRAEGYNMFNNTSFQEVNRNISQANFGTYSVVAQSPRFFQLGARFIF